MKEHDSRIAIRLPSHEKGKIRELVRKGDFKNISQVIRVALKEFLKEVH